MSRRAPRPLAGAVDAFTEALAPASLLGDVQRVWGEVVGATVAAEAQPTAERDGVLTVSAASAVWAQELDLMGPQLVARINGRLGRDALLAVRCRATPPPSPARPA